MSQRLLCVLILIFQGLLALSQPAKPCTYHVEGQIFNNKDKQPLPYIRVKIKDGTQGTLSDENGYFKLEALCDKEYEIEFSGLGFKTLTHHHDFHHSFEKVYLAPEDLMIESVVIEAEQVKSNLATVSSSRVDAETMALMSSKNLGAILETIAGVSMLSTGQNISKPIIHGLHSNRVLIINNGLRHEFQNWGLEHAPEIDPSLVDQIEVVKGAATVRYGPDALGGVVLVDPPKLELSTPLKGELSLGGQSNGQSLDSKVRLQKGFKWLSLQASASYYKQGDLHAPDYMLTNTGQEEKSYQAGIRIHPFAQLDIEAFYSSVEQNLGILRGSVFGNLTDLQRAIASTESGDEPLQTSGFSYDLNRPRQDVGHDLFKASISYTGEHHSLSVVYGNQLNKRREFGIRRSDAPNIDLELRTESLELIWTHPRLGPFSGKIGAQWQRQANDNQPGTNTVPFIPNYDSDLYGIFLIEKVALGNTTLELGIRYDSWEADVIGREPDNTIYQNLIKYENFSGTLGLKQQLNEYWSFRTNLGTAWRAPNVAELYQFGQHGSFIEYGLWRYEINERFDLPVANGEILDPEERPVPAETGYKWINTLEVNRQSFQAELTAYINFIDNFIFSRPAGVTRTTRGLFVYYLYDQTDALFWGGDLSVRWNHHKQWSSRFQASYLWAKQTQSDDFFVGLPPANLGYQLRYSPQIKGLAKNELRLGMNYHFKQTQFPRVIPLAEFVRPDPNARPRFTDDAPDFDILAPPDAYFLTDLAWTAAWKQIEWSVQLNNIFNTRYRNYTNRLRYFADEMGRNVIVNVRWKF